MKKQVLVEVGAGLNYDDVIQLSYLAMYDTS